MNNKGLSIEYSMTDSEDGEVKVNFQVVEDKLSGGYNIEYIEFLPLCPRPIVFDEFIIPSILTNPENGQRYLIDSLGNSDGKGIFYMNSVYTKPYIIKKLIIENGIRSIRPYCFNNSKINTIVWAKSCLNIPEKAFLNSSLSKITGIEKVQTIEDSAFSFCKKLETFRWPDNCKEIPNGCFYNSSSLSKITNLNSVKKITFAAFSFTAISEIQLPYSCMEIEQHAFSHCKNLKHFDWPQGCLEVPENCFFLTPLKELDISSSSLCIIKDVSITKEKIISGIYNSYKFDYVDNDE